MRTVIDTSALCAVLLGEADAESFAAAMRTRAGDLVVGAPTLVECSIVLQARVGPEGVADLRVLCERLAVHIAPFTADDAATAVEAWRRFGKGRHPAGLNLGDCFSYATAKGLGADLLFKGNDFDQTDITAAACH